MTTVCCYFQLHQPRRLKRYSVFDAGTDYFDDTRNRQILRRITHKCYEPATRAILEQIHATDGRFRVAFSLTGCLLDQFEAWEPELIDRFRDLAQTGCVEFLGETSHHSLAAVFDAVEFFEQVETHAQRIEDLFGQRPRVFRNTELIYSNDLAAVLAEGATDVLAGRSPDHVYLADGSEHLAVLLKNHTLSDDIAFRFSDPQWEGYPLTAASFAQRLLDAAAPDDADAPRTVGLFMDFETFGEHHWPETGILDFLAQLPHTLLEAGCAFRTPAECVDQLAAVDTYDCPRATSWADTERDLSAWLGNAMQTNAQQELYRLAPAVREAGDDTLLEHWRRLTVSDHAYYMCTKAFADGDVHAYFNPYESPYDAYINFMNVLDHVRSRVESLPR